MDPITYFWAKNFVHKGTSGQTISIVELEADVINQFNMTQQILTKFNSLQLVSTSELKGQSGSW